MKKRFVFLLLNLCFRVAEAQINDRTLNTIEVIGSSKMVIVPDAYIAQILIEEEEQRINYQVIGKLSIDSVKMQFLKQARKYGISETDLKLLVTSSRPLGQFPYFLSNAAYECVLKNKEQGKQLVNELRFGGLKGIVVKGQYANAALLIQDTLYGAALKDAQRVAGILANKSNKTIGALKNVLIQDRQIPSVGRDTDNFGDIYNAYNLTKFEIENKEKFATCTMRVTFEIR